MRLDRERIAGDLGIAKCAHCLRLCPYCPRLIAALPSLHPTALTGPPNILPPDPPLAGDLVAALVKRFGADRAAKYVERKLGKPCGCEARRAKLNTLHTRLRRYFDRKPR